MNDKPFTLYYIPQLKNINQYNFPTETGKISDVRTVSKGITLIGHIETPNHYMIVGDKPSIISMGMVKKTETKDKNVIYIGRRIYSNSQKTLFDYIKKEVTKKIQHIQKEIVRVQDLKKNLSSIILGTDIHDVYIDQMYKQIKTIKTNSKQLIINFKKL